MKPENILFLFVCCTALVLGMILPEIHDYSAYIKQWKVISDGLDPYFETGNAYGVIYNYFAYLNISRLIHFPRMIFIATYLIASYQIWNLSKNRLQNYSNWVLTILIINPLFWIFSIKYGSNDSFLAGITLIAVLSYQNKNYFLTGVLFSIGFCFKFIPIFIIPFFIISRTKINYKLMFSFIASTSIIYSIGFIQWGNSVAYPFIFGERRASKILSIFRFIRSQVQPLKFFGIDNLDGISIQLTLIFFILIFLAYLILNLDRYLSSLLSLSSVLLFYKVGHHQFYILFMLLTIFTIIYKKDVLLKNNFFLYSTITFFAWIFFFTILYDFTSAYVGRYSLIRIWIGLPTFLIHLVFSISLIIAIRNHKKSMNKKLS